jgi:SagB-type dehydrogenase family enzyme
MAKYPLELYVAAGSVTGMPAGLYRYEPGQHQLLLVKQGDLRADLSPQPSTKEAPVVFLFTGNTEKMRNRMADRAASFVNLEAGHAAQNLCLQATALHLGVVTVGGFDPAKLKDKLQLPEKETALYLLPVGKPQK